MDRSNILTLIRNMAGAVALVFFSHSAFACDTPTTNELSSLFNGNQNWSNYDSDPENLMNITLDFDNPSASTAIWGSSTYSGSSFGICKDDDGDFKLKFWGISLPIYKLRNGIIKVDATGYRYGMHQFQPGTGTVQVADKPEEPEAPAQRVISRQASGQQSQPAFASDRGNSLGAISR